MDHPGDTVPNIPLPPDIESRLAVDYPDATAEARAILARIPADHPRVIRCVLHLAEGRLDELAHQVQNAIEDYRDVIFWAEYEDRQARHPRRVRDFNRPFGAS